jgi:hypothetical protein
VEQPLLLVYRHPEFTACVRFGITCGQPEQYLDGVSWFPPESEPACAPFWAGGIRTCDNGEIPVPL